MAGAEFPCFVSFSKRNFAVLGQNLLISCILVTCYFLTAMEEQHNSDSIMQQCICTMASVQQALVLAHNNKFIVQFGIRRETLQDFKASSQSQIFHYF